MTTEKPNSFAFIDSQNVNLAIREQGWKLDFARFRVYLREKYSRLLKPFAPNKLDFMNNLHQKLSIQEKGVHKKRGPITRGRNRVNLPSS